MKKLTLFLILLSTFQVSFAAITYGNTTTTTATCSVSTKSINITVAGSDTALAVTVANHFTLATISGVTATKGGVPTSMTLATTTNNGSVRVGMWYILNPDPGSITITTTASTAAGCIAMGAVVLQGVDQTTQPDAVSVKVQTTTSFSQSVTTVADNAMQVLALAATSGVTLTAGANTTIGSQPEVAAFGTAFVYSTAAQTPAGTATLTVTSSNQGFVGAMMSFKPASAATPVNKGAILKLKSLR